VTKTILERLDAGEILLCDGAMGTFLQAKGLEPGTCPELWSVDRAADVQDIHRAYREAGSDIVECNSFGGTRYKLGHYDLSVRAAELNRAAAAIAREVAGTDQYVLGSAGPTGEFMAPLGLEPEEAFYRAFAEQVSAFEEGGADAVIVESMSALEEATVAVRAARENTELTVFATMTFDPQMHGGYATIMGVTPAQAATELVDAGAHIIGTNCGTGADQMINVVREMRTAAPEHPIIAMPNAGMPELENGETVFKETPEQMAGKAIELVRAGATVIGGCCGTGPEHIAAMKAAITTM